MNARRESLAIGAIAAVAAARTMLAISPALRFDTDPAQSPGALAGIGPSGSFILDAIGLGAVALLLFERRARAGSIGFAPLLVLLTLPAFLATALAGDGAFSDLWRGASWMAAAFAASVVAGGGSKARVIVGAVLLGALAAMLVRGASQVLVEHPAMVADFNANRESFLAARGWPPGSPAALSFERRVRQVEASGWFGLANIYSGVLVAGAAALAAIAWSMKRSATTQRQLGATTRHADPSSSRQPSVRTAQPSTSVAGLLCAVLALGAIVLVVVNGSKGAIATLLIVAGAALVLALARGRAARAIPWLLILLALAGFLAAFVRGAILGEVEMSERSLLFRWYYLLGTARLFVTHWWPGVGAGGFQDAYLISRPWFSPEEVMSAHSAWLDWLAAFGVAGVGLVALSVRLAWRALRGAAEPSAESTAPRAEASAERAQTTAQPNPAAASGATGAAARSHAELPTIATCASLAGSALAVGSTSWTDLEPAALTVRAAATLAAALAAWSAASVMQAADRSSDAAPQRTVLTGFALAALALLVHGQVDMDFWHPSAVWWCWLMMGTAATAWPRASPARRVDRVIRPVLMVVTFAGAAWLAITGLRAGAQERALERAARRLEEAVAASEPLPRARAAELIEQSLVLEPRNEVVWQAALEQMLFAMDQIPRDSAQRQALLERAVVLGDSAYSARPCAATAKLRLDAHHRRLMERFGGPAEVALRLAQPAPTQPMDGPEADAVVAAAEEYLRRDPRSTGAWIQLSEIQWLLGHPSAAVNAARRALVVDASFALDPLRRLSDFERERLERRARSSK